MSKTKVKTKSVDFHLGVDDTIILMIKQKTSEFTIIHNNDLACECNFCVGIKDLMLRLHKHVTKETKGNGK